MGRGAGCASSKPSVVEPTAQEGTTATPATAKAAEAPPATATTTTTTNGTMSTTKIFIIYYSSYGHVAQLAKKVKEGVDSVPGAEGILYQVKETLPAEVTAKMHIPPQSSDIPFADSHNLTEADGFIFGFPTRFGGVPAQFKAFWDSTGGLWQSGALNGKPFGLFTSNGTLGGGQEVTLLGSLSNFIHHGMIYVPLGYSFGPQLFSLDAVRGGSPWGAGTFAGPDGSRQPTELELNLAEHQGKYTAGIIKKLAA